MSDSHEDRRSCGEGDAVLKMSPVSPKRKYVCRLTRQGEKGTIRVSKKKKKKKKGGGGGGLSFVDIYPYQMKMAVGEYMFHVAWEGVLLGKESRVERKAMG